MAHGPDPAEDLGGGRSLDGGPPPAVCWLGGARYTSPLEPGVARKWRLLARLGAPMHVVGFSSGVRPRSFEEHASFHLLPRVPAAFLRYLVMFACAPWVVLWISARHDVGVIIAQSPFEGAILAAVKLALRAAGRRVALVVESHGDFERSLFLQRRIVWAAPYRWTMRRAARFALRHADVGRAVSGTARRQLSAWRPDLPVLVFPTWVDVETFGMGSRHTPPSRCNDVLYAGALIPRKGVEVLVDAFERVAGRVLAARLTIAGPRENRDHAARLDRRVAEAGLAGRVRFAGEVSAAGLVALMDSARVLVLPSYSEGLARVVLEAMLRGTPVVATRVDGAPDVVRPAETGYLVEPGDHVGLADAIEAAFGDPSIDEMGVRARQRASELVSSETYLSRHRELLTAALAARASLEPSFR